MSHAANEYVKHLQKAPNGEKITPSEKAVLGQLADDHRQEVGVAWAATSSVAARACMTTRHCRRIMRELERKGVIETTPNLRESNGAQTSNECRFCELDPPFNMKNQSVTAKRMELQKVARLRRPVQAKLYPPDTDVRGGRTPKSGGGGHRSPGGQDTDVRGPRTPSSALDFKVDPSVDSSGETLFDPQRPTLPSRVGRENSLSKIDNERWNGLQSALKSQIKSITGKLERDKGFTRIRPDEDDYDTCFRGWWPEDLRRLPHGLLVVTIAEDEDATLAGIEKYRSRLVKLAQKYFLHGETKTVTFKVLRAPTRPAAETLVDLVLSAKPDKAVANEWDQVKAEIKYRIEQLPMRESMASMDYYRQGIEQVKLLGIEMDGDKPVWRLQSLSASKTRGIFSLLRSHVTQAIKKVSGGEVQIVVEQPGA